MCISCECIRVNLIAVNVVCIDFCNCVHLCTYMHKRACTSKRMRQREKNEHTRADVIVRMCVHACTCKCDSRRQHSRSVMVRIQSCISFSSFCLMKKTVRIDQGLLVHATKHRHTRSHSRSHPVTRSHRARHEASLFITRSHPTAGFKNSRCIDSRTCSLAGFFWASWQISLHASPPGTRAAPPETSRTPSQRCAAQMHLECFCVP